MNINELINADLFPRNVPKPSSFHENTLKPEVPEVSLMFDGGFQFNRPNEANKQTQQERSNKSSIKIADEAARDIRCGSPVVSDPSDYNIQEILLLKNSKQHLTPNKYKSKQPTPSKNSKPNGVDSVKSSSDETDIGRQNGGLINRHVNTENHLIEPVESYSVWKYKNQHMFVKDGGQVTRKEIENYGSPEYRNQVNENRESSNKPPYRPNYEQNEVEMRNIHKSLFEQNSLDHRMEYLKYRQEMSHNVEYANRNEGYRMEEDCVPSLKFAGKSPWRTAPPMMPNISEPVARYSEAIPYQRRTSDGTNGVTELCKIVEFQTKHIEFLNEQIYTLTLQNKTLSNLTKHIKSLEDTQVTQFEFLKKNFDKLQETILSVNKENNLVNKLPCPEMKTLNNEKVEDHLDRMEKKLIDLINTKLNSNAHSGPTVLTHTQTEEDDEDETSSCEDIVPVVPKNNTIKQCKCACDSPKQQSIKPRQKEISSKPKQKSPPTKTDHRGAIRHLEQKTNGLKYNGKGAQEWECPPGHSKQTCSKKSNKKIQRNPPERVEQLVLNPTKTKAVPQPILYYQQPVYQGDKFASNNPRVNQGEKQKKDKIKISPDQKQSVSRLKKTTKPKMQPYARNNGGVNYRGDNTLMNEEHSLTLNARELPVISEHIPSPEASVHIDMGEYQSSSSEFEDSDQENRDLSENTNEENENEEGAPWPTFYNNVVGKVHRLLQDNQQDEGQEDQYRTVQVRMATMDQFRKMGISFVDESPNSKRVTFNKSKTKLNVQHDNHAGEGAKRSPLTAVCNTNLSFASLQYLQRYHLLPSPTVQTQEAFHPTHITDQED